MRTISRREEHVGELKLSVWADTLAQLFAEVARFIARECGEATGEPLPWRPISLEAKDATTVLVDWANDLVGRAEIDQIAYSETRMLRVSGGTIGGQIRGRHVEVFISPLKAATFHDLLLEKRDGRWHCVILFDV